MHKYLKNGKKRIYYQRASAIAGKGTQKVPDKNSLLRCGRHIITGIEPGITHRSVQRTHRQKNKQMNIVKHENSFAGLMTVAEAFAQSGIFSDAKNAAQAFVKIMAGAEMGMAPFQAMTGIHIIAGKPVIGAGLMASRVKGFGKYDYSVAEHTDKICSIDFLQDGKVLGNSTFTIEDARKAGTKNLDKFPKNMLFARAISNGVKWFTPDIFSVPVYVPEEMAEQVESGEQKEIDDALLGLIYCESITDLKAWKEAVPGHVVKIQQVHQASLAKYEEIRNKPKESDFITSEPITE